LAGAGARESVTIGAERLTQIQADLVLLRDTTTAAAAQ